MDKDTQGIAILISISVIVAAISHLLLRPFLLACVAAALTSTILFQMASLLELGHIDKFFPIAVVVGAVYAFIIALPVGATTRFIRSRHL